MTANTKIEWADHTFNPWEGCTRVGPGCDHCYAAARNARFAHGVEINWGPGAPRRRTSPENWAQPLKWNAKRFMQCAACGWRGHVAAELIGCGGCGSIDHLNDARPRVFCASLADVFDNEVDPQWRVDLFRLIIDTPNLDWLLLTKRIGNASRMLQDVAERFGVMMNAADQYKPLANVWIGATVVNQEEADRDIPKLLQVPAAKRFLSIEPMLGPISLDDIDCGGVGEDVIPREYWTDVDDDDSHPALALNALEGYYWQRWGDWERESKRLNWVIAGGESGPHARPAHPEWFANLRKQCAAAGVPFLFKQWGEWAPRSDSMPLDLLGGDDAYVTIDGDVHTIADNYPFEASDVLMYRIGKKAAGRVLDGRTHDGFPS